MVLRSSTHIFARGFHHSAYSGSLSACATASESGSVKSSPPEPRTSVKASPSETTRAPVKSSSSAGPRALVKPPLWDLELQ